MKSDVTNEHIHGFFDEYFPLSNFFDNNCMQVTRYGIGFTSVEAAFQASKTCLDPEKSSDLRKYKTLLAVFSRLTPDEAKVLGRNIKICDNWEEIKDEVMFNLVYQKFYNDLNLRAILLSTGSKHLEETNNWHDNYWGNCTCDKCKDINGKNHLGLILMKVRELLSKQ